MESSLDSQLISLVRALAVVIPLRPALTNDLSKRDERMERKAN